MKILKGKIEFIVLVLIFYLNVKVNAQTPPVQLIPIPENLKFGPKTHERIIVPVDDVDYNEKDVKKEHHPPPPPPPPTSPKNLRRKNSHEGRKSVKDDNKIIVKNEFSPIVMQPLHINTEVFENTTPDHTRETKEQKKKRFRLQEERIKIKNLPEDTKDIPTTTWFDNLGKYNYGIIHYNIEDVPTLEDITEPAQGESKEVINPVLASPIVVPPLPPQIKFKSSFRDPTVYAQIHSPQDNMGKFLYKTQVYYPNYRDHVYLPVTTYYGDNQGITKDLPIFNAHTVVHNAPPSPPPPHPPPKPQPHPIENVKKSDAENQHQNARKSPQNPKKAYNHKKPVEAPKKPVHPTKRPPPPKPTPRPTPPPPPTPPKKKQPAEEEEEDYDYQEGDDDEDYEDAGNNDKQRANESAEEEEEDDDYDEEEEESQENDRKKSYKRKDSSESDEDQFDKAWSKFGYGPKDKQSAESDSYESSESQSQPERIKIVHMKMEVQTTPLRQTEGDYEDVSEEESKTHEVQSPNFENKKKPKDQQGAKNQAQHPNAGPDDLKYFQYLSYLGNGEHRAGGRLGNDKHYVEQHERANKALGTFQKKVKWADKEGGFGEHYWDLNHG